MKKILLPLIIIFTMSFLGGCSSSTESDNIINISILNSKPEIQLALEDAIKEFSKINPSIKIKTVKYSENNSHSNKIQSLYSTENAPTLSIVEGPDLMVFNDNLANLSDEQWAKEANDTISDLARNSNGEIIALPFATEAMGFIYNKSVLTEAGVDVNSINTINGLENAFKKVEAIGKKAIIISNEAWSLGNHFFPTAFAVQSNDSNDVVEYFNKVIEGKEKLATNEKVNGLLDTFDVMKKYNQYSSSPLSPSYDRCVESLANGEVGFWYMGNWAYDLLVSSNSSNTDYGFAPVPISNNSSEFGNNEIVLGITKYIVIDKVNNSEEQQIAAKEFLNWLLYDEAGQDFVINKAGIIPAINSQDTEYKESLTQSMLSYRENDTTLELMIPYIFEDNSENIGRLLRDYLSNKIDRTTLLNDIQNYLERK